MGALQVKATDFDVIEDLIIIVLADEFETSDDEFVSLSRIRERIPKFGANPIREAIRGLNAKHYLTARTEMRSIGPMGVGQERQVTLEQYRATRLGIEYVTSFEEGYVANLWSELSDQTDLAENQNRHKHEDHWEPLPIDRSSLEFQQMTEAAERAIERIEGDNGYAAKEPEERSTILNALKGALKAVKEGWPSKVVVKSSLLAPLRFVAEKFFGTGIGEAAKKAVDALIKWLSCF